MQAPIIMMSQNRQAQKDRLNAAADYEVNMKAEMEIIGCTRSSTSCARRPGAT